MHFGPLHFYLAFALGFRKRRCVQTLFSSSSTPVITSSVRFQGFGTRRAVWGPLASRRHRLVPPRFTPKIATIARIDHNF